MGVPYECGPEKTDIEIWTDLHFCTFPDYENVVFRCTASTCGCIRATRIHRCTNSARMQHSRAYQCLVCVYWIWTFHSSNRDTSNGPKTQNRVFLWNNCNDSHYIPTLGRTVWVLVFRKIVFFFPWSESESELYWPTDRRLSAKWLPTSSDRGCHVVSVTEPYNRIVGFLDRSRYFSIK
jgi:hypothetical protein